MQFLWLLEEIFDGINNIYQYEEYEKIAPLGCCSLLAWKVHRH